MARYQVCVDHETMVFEVEANSEAEAEGKAMELASWESAEISNAEAELIEEEEQTRIE